MTTRRTIAVTMGVALALSGLVTGVPSASAAPPPSVVRYLVPRDRASKPTKTANLTFQRTGAPVETTPHVYVSFWGTEWSATPDAQAYVTGFMSNVGGSSWLQTTNQYCQGLPAGTVSCNGAGTPIANPPNQATIVTDSTPVPAHPSSSDIIAAAKRIVGISGQPFDPNALYMVLTPQGKSQRGFGTSFCAYHGATSYTAGTLAYSYVPYQPDSPPCNDNPDGLPYGGFSLSAGHEYAEAQTDPVPTTGWADGRGAEIGDKCETIVDRIVLAGVTYSVQPLWSNAASACVLSS